MHILVGTVVHGQPLGRFGSTAYWLALGSRSFMKSVDCILPGILRCKDNIAIFCIMYIHICSVYSLIFVDCHTWNVIPWYNIHNIFTMHVTIQLK